jgi:hypothetical protein
MVTKSEYIENFKTALGDGILVGVENDQETPEGSPLQEYGGSSTYYHYHLNYKAIGKNERGETAFVGATHHFAVKDEDGTEEMAYPIFGDFDNPAAKDPSGGSALVNIAGLYSNESLRGKCLGAVIKAAYNILNESGATEHHSDRIQLAGDVLQNASRYQSAFMFFIATNATVQTNGPGNTTDNDIEYIVNSSWNQVCEAVGNWTA